MEPVKEWINRKGITRTAFADKIRANKSQVTRWLDGTHKPSLPALRRIRDVTGISLDKLAKSLE